MTERNDEMLLLADYARVSSPLQRNNSSIAMQSQYNHNLSLSRQAVYVDHYWDEGTSAYSGKLKDRKALQKLLHDVRAGRINGLVFYSEDRLDRTLLSVYEDLIFPVLRINPSFKYFKSSTGEEWDPFSVTAKRALIHAAYESQKKAALARSMQRTKLEKNQRPGGPLPVGIGAVTDGRIVVNKDFPLVLLIFELASIGYSERHIAELVSQLDVEKPILFTHTSVHHILHNPIYIGWGLWNRRKNRHNSAPRPTEQSTLFAEYPAVINPQLWDLAHVQLARGKSQKKTEFLLSSIVKCGNCDSVLLTKNRSKMYKGTRQTSTRDGNPLIFYCCSQCGMRVSADEVHQMLFTDMEKHLATQMTSGKVKSELNSRIAKLERLLTQEKGDLESLLLNLSRFQSKVQHSVVDSEIVDVQERVQNVIARQRAEIGRLTELIARLKGFLTEETTNVIRTRATSIIRNLPTQEQRCIVTDFVSELKLFQLAKGNYAVTVEYSGLPIPLA